MTPPGPSWRFRDVRLLIAAALVTLLGMVGVELHGVFEVTNLAQEQARRGASAAARAAASELATGEAPRFGAALKADGWGLRVWEQGVAVRQVGELGPGEPPWWPWHSREDWERAAGEAAGPVLWHGGRYIVAYQPLADGRVVQIVVHSPWVAEASRWRLLGAMLGLGVACGGGLLVWLLIARALAPYGELMVEAERVSPGGGAGQGEDRFLIETFRTTVARLEASELAVRHRADELAVLAGVLTRESSAGVVITDAAGAVRASNPVASLLLGPRLEVGRALPAELEGDGRLAIGDRVVETRRFPLHSDTGESQGEVIFLADRTHLEALERSLHEREQMAALGELSAGMTHELRNALATIRGYLRLLREASGERRDTYVNAIDDEAAVLGGVLERFLRFAEPRELRREAVDLRALVSEVIAKLAASFPGVQLEQAGSAPTCLADRMAVAVIFENLIRNAAEAVARSSGRVDVRLGVTGDRAVVVVADNGPGLDPEVRARLFRPFVSSKPSGGLGLALARRFARLHGGDVRYEEREGGGCLFVLELPLGGVA
jgi:signal transduction histidine kinase